MLSSAASAALPLSKSLFQRTFVTRIGAALNSVINGTGETSHSDQVGRRPTVYEIQINDIKPELRSEHLAIVEELSNYLSKDKKTCEAVAALTVEVGTHLDSSVLFWKHDGYVGVDSTQSVLLNDPVGKKLRNQLLKTVSSRSSALCLEFQFWHFTAPPPAEQNDPRVFELRSYTLKPGHLLEWSNHWQKGLEYRRQVCTPVGAFFSQLGPLNTVHHLWCYKSLADRRQKREAAWSVEGWADTVRKTVPLVDKMETRILYPTSFSNLK